MTLQEFFAALKEALLNLLPQTQPERAAMGIGAAVGAVFNFIFGGLDQTLSALFVLVTLDFVTGWAASGKEGTLRSEKGRNGIKHKVFMFMAVAFCNVIDRGMGLPQTLRSMAVCAYSANEALSILENVYRMGYGQYIPTFLQSKIEQIRAAKAGVKTEKESNQC
jgi:toxin secretion/phage lysis holin